MFRVVRSNSPDMGISDALQRVFFLGGGGLGILENYFLGTGERTSNYFQGAGAQALNIGEHCQNVVF